jgi:2-succinyl-6-hydroxy-2,4-cyclohexadiene-1-carboxylate synthase
MILASQTLGSGVSATFLHGFTQTAQSWAPVVEQLTAYLSCTVIDAPGHGDTPAGRRSLSQCGDDIAQSMNSGVLVGYSMGARMALHAALQHPEKVTHLVLVSGTAGIDDEAERQQRVASDTDLASRIESIGVPSFIDEWLSLPMFSGLTPEKSQREERLRNTAVGLADSLRFAGTGTQQPLWDVLPTLRMPVLFIAGDQDKKFVQLAQRMHELVDSSTLAIVPESGHSVHLEATSVFVEILLRWLHDNKAIVKPAP